MTDTGGQPATLDELRAVIRAGIEQLCDELDAGPELRAILLRQPEHDEQP